MRLSAVLSLAVLLASCASIFGSNQSAIPEKIYVAVEGKNHVAVLDPATQTVMKTIDLHGFSPHNVQVAPNGKSVWVTANRGHGGHSEEEVLDQIVVIDPRTDTIVGRIPTAPGAHLAHVVVTKDGALAYATAQERGAIYKIDARNFAILKEIAASKGSEPHGLRIAPDGKTAYVAFLQGKGMGILNLRTDTLTTIPLEGNAVQTGVTPDGKLTLVSLYDTKQIAVFNTATRGVSYIDLPRGAKGPIQMYPTPDSRYVYVADQGYYFDQPTGNRVYKIDLLSGSVVVEIPVGEAPHGVVVSPDGKAVYVTNLLTQDVSIIDAASDTEIGRVGVGTMPNGISVWSETSGGTP